MKSKKATKRALLTSAMSLVLCFAMLLGTTFAWFTDEAKTGVNTIQSGTLDVQLLAEDGTTSLESQSLNFVKAEGGEGQEVLWEPGATYYTQGFQIKNAGNLYLKFQLVVNGVSNGNAKLLEAIDFYVATNVNDESTYVELNEFASGEYKLAPGETYGSATLYLVGHMKEEAGNEYQDLTIEGVGITVYATQVEAEFDSFGDDYDAAAPVVTYEVTPDTIQDYLDGKYGSTSNMKLVLTEGDYGTLVLGRPTKYAGSNTTYICGNGNPHTDVVYETADAEAFKEHLADGKWHTTPKYVTTVENLQLTVKEGADVTVAGVQASSGHAYGDVYDYVRDIDYDVGSAYYSTLLMKDVTFTGITFVAGSDISTSDAETVIDGVTFEDCTFTGTSTESDTGAAIRYYNEANNGNVKNLTVTGCSFTTWYQGIYTHHVKGITVTKNTFDTTGHNAVALQGHAGAVDHGAVVISNNRFTNIKDRVIRFNNVGSGTQITIKYNVAKNSGDNENQVIKATSIENGVVFDVNYNNWGENKTVANEQFKDADEDVAVVSTADELASALTNGGNVVLVEDVQSTTTATGYGQADIKLNGGTLDGNGNTLSVKGSGDYCAVVTTGGTIKNLTIDNGFRGIFLENLTEDVYIDSATLGGEGVCYCINTGEGAGIHDLFVTNSTIRGWTSIGTAVKSVSFTNCVFGQGEYYTNVYGRLVKPYVDAVFENCEFNSKFYIDLSALTTDGDGNVVNPGAKVVLRNCTVNGVKLTADNWTSLIVAEDDCGEGQISIEGKDGSYMTAENIFDYVVIENS